MRIKEAQDGRWEVRFKYNPQAIEQIKAAIPYFEREWNGGTKAWIVTPSKTNERVLLQMDKVFFSGNLVIPSSAPKASVGIRFRSGFEIKYIGIPKDRGGRMVSSGQLRNAPVRKSWRVIFPEDVLKAWFIPGYQSTASTSTPVLDTLYSILAISADADNRQIKKGYRLAAKTWHPDVNSDPQAGARFIEIDNAYKLLRDPLKRRRYDAGLELAATLINPTPTRGYSQTDWRPPIRCGIITGEGQKVGDFFHIEKIMRWLPIQDDRGYTLVTTWPFGASEAFESWV